MDCRTARSLLVYHRPGASELDAADREFLEAHLADCPECDSLARAERQIDGHLARAMRDVPVPANLRKRILTQLAQNREDWYRRWLARGMRVAAVAALVLVGLFVWISWKQQALPRPDNEALLADAQQPSYSPPDPQDAERFFAKHSEAVQVPERFNYQFFTSYGLAPFHGKLTPEMVFSNGPSTAWVYILSSKVFNLNDVKEDTKPGEDGYRFKVQIWKENGSVYVIRYLGDLNDLLRTPNKS